MTDDDTFRLIMGFTFAAFLSFALYHGIRSNSDEKIDRWQQGAFILFGLRFECSSLLHRWHRLDDQPAVDGVVVDADSRLATLGWVRLDRTLGHPSCAVLLNSRHHGDERLEVS